MLVSLHVKNLALIEEVEVEFGRGLNILSGETGAGKSIIIGSINLALGEKVPKEMLRENTEYALVELIFKVENQQQKKVLQEMDIFPEDGEIIMSRKITPSRSVGKINSEIVSASCMREVAALLIDIHGQHEHQSLLHKKRHLEILDEYAKEELKEKKEALKRCYSEYQKLLEEKKTAITDDVQRERELSFLEYEIREIEEAALIPEEDEVLESSYRRMINSRKIMEAVNNAHELTGGHESATDWIGRALRELSAVAEYDSELGGIIQQIDEIDNLLNDFNRELAAYISKGEFDEETFYKIENRLNEVNHLKEKFGGSIEAVLNAKEEKEHRYEQLKDYGQYLEVLEQKIKKTEKVLKKICKEVSEIRKCYAKNLTGLVQKALVDLNFLDVEFTMKFQETETYTANGYDDAEFLISTNPGEPVKPLGQVASGGELSRIMLAIKAVLAESDQIETLIFDEIDSGISGRTAQMVAEKMNVIGEKHQVICITHLPQIAAMADQHFLISKNVVNQTTISNIFKLQENETIEELARMLGGVKVTSTVLESAKEMKELAYSVKKNQS